MAEKENILITKSFDFAVRVVNLYKFLEKNERVLSKQLLSSGTAIGAISEEAIGAQSDADFINKLSIAYKEARESLYWIRLLNKTGYLSEKEYSSIYKDGEELIKILTKIIKTSKDKKIVNNINS